MKSLYGGVLLLRIRAPLAYRLLRNESVWCVASVPGRGGFAACNFYPLWTQRF